jgi:hypothetical protein
MSSVSDRIASYTFAGGVASGLERRTLVERRSGGERRLTRAGRRTERRSGVELRSAVERRRFPWSDRER